MEKIRFGQGVAASKVVVKQKHNKYNAIKTMYNGQLYDSKHEAAYAQHLDVLRKASDPKKRVADIERQVKFSFDHNGFHICSLIVDFKITYADGRVEYHDPKGKETREASIKKKLAKAFYGIDVKFV